MLHACFYKVRALCFVGPWWRSSNFRPCASATHNSSCAHGRKYFRRVSVGSQKSYSFPADFYANLKYQHISRAARRRAAECFNRNHLRKGVRNPADFVRRSRVSSRERKQYSTIFPLLAITRTEKGPSGATLLNLSSFLLIRTRSREVGLFPTETEEYIKRPHPGS